MISPVSDIASETWQAEGHATRIEYSRAVMQELGILATAGFNRLTHGGVEIGGVLFGARNSDSIEILAHRALTCEYAFGPSFTLSEKDGQALKDSLASAAADPELAGMQAVGWYHSHTRSEISLSEKDLELYQRYFPESWQIALVLRPNRFDPVRAGFFFRERDGSVHADATKREFVIHPPRRKPAAGLEADAEPVDDRPRVAPAAAEPVTAAIVALQPLLDPELPVPEPEPKTIEFAETKESAGTVDKIRWILRAATIALVAVTAGYWIVNLRPGPGVSLRALDNGGQLRIEWNCDPRVIRKAVSGALEIEDGTLEVRNELSKDQLRTGSATYMRNSGNVLVRLVIRGPDQAIRTETTRFLGSPVEAVKMPADTTAHEAEARGSERPEVVSAPSGSEKPAPSARDLDPPPQRIASEARGKLESSPLTFNVPSTNVPPINVPPTRARQFVSPRANVVHSRGADVGRVDAAPPPLPSVATYMAPKLPELLPPLPAPEAPKPLYRGPLEGKIIWTGKLARHGTVQIQGNRASQGYLTGGLPGVPVRVQVFPAEFTSAGLRIFTADSKMTHDTEAPGAQNGWNRTAYVWNPAQADKLRVIEPPGPQNAWNRVVLRAERGEHSIIVLSWELATAGSSAQAASDR